MSMSGVTHYAIRSLDSTKKYCMADTMALVDIHRNSLDSVSGMRDALNNKTLLLTRKVMLEVADKCRELDGLSRNNININKFERDISKTLNRSNIPFMFVKIPNYVLKQASIQHVRDEYPNRYGIPLSLVDCILLSTSAHFPNIDVMTSDCALSDAISSVCEASRTCTSRTDYYKRRYNTAWFIKLLLGSDVEWVETGNILAYISDGGDSILLNTSKKDAYVTSCTVHDKPYVMQAVITFFMLPMQTCECGANHYSNRATCTCKDIPYSPDSGLGTVPMNKFLNTLSASARNNLWKITKSFR